MKLTFQNIKQKNSELPFIFIKLYPTHTPKILDKSTNSMPHKQAQTTTYENTYTHSKTNTSYINRT